MTAFITRTIRQAAFVVAFAASLSALSSTSSFAYTAEAQQMCTGDAFRLCSSEIPNIPAITACMVKHRERIRTPSVHDWVGVAPWPDFFSSFHLL